MQSYKPVLRFSKNYDSKKCCNKSPYFAGLGRIIHLRSISRQFASVPSLSSTIPSKLCGMESAWPRKHAWQCSMSVPEQPRMPHSLVGTLLSSLSAFLEFKILEFWIAFKVSLNSRSENATHSFLGP